MRALSHRLSFVTFAAVAALALSVTACSVGPLEVSGGAGGSEPGWQSPGGDGTSESGADDGSTDDGSTNDGSTNDGNSGAAPSVGTIEVKVERVGAATRMFTLEASECEVSVDRIRVVGAGSEDGTGVGAEIDVDTTLRQVLHAPTSTYSASGHITLSVADGSTWVSDGRPSRTSGVNLPSMFEYRVIERYAEFRTAWFGSAGDSAGFVHAWCD